jgi:hypothetical protein
MFFYLIFRKFFIILRHKIKKYEKGSVFISNSACYFGFGM